MAVIALALLSHVLSQPMAYAATIAGVALISGPSLKFPVVGGAPTSASGAPQNNLRK